MKLPESQYLLSMNKILKLMIWPVLYLAIDSASLSGFVFLPSPKLGIWFCSLAGKLQPRCSCSGVLCPPLGAGAGLGGGTGGSALAGSFCTPPPCCNQEANRLQGGGCSHSDEWIKLLLSWLMWIDLCSVVLERQGHPLILFTVMLPAVGKGYFYCIDFN